MNEKATILAVDDTPASLELLVIVLTRAGYEVRSAESGELALAAVEANPPDLILLDVRMRGMDGLEVCRRLKAREERSRPLVEKFLQRVHPLSHVVALYFAAVKIGHRRGDPLQQTATDFRIFDGTNFRQQCQGQIGEIASRLTPGFFGQRILVTWPATPCLCGGPNDQTLAHQAT